MSLRETRRFKSRGFVVSFGDIMLPLVGVVAIGLLMVAAKFFFFSGLNAEKTTLPVILGAPVVRKPAEPRMGAAGVVSHDVPQEALPPTPLASVPSESSEGVRPSEEEEGVERLLPTPRPSFVSLDVLAVPVAGKQGAPTERPLPPKAAPKSPEKKTGTKAVFPKNIPAPAKAPSKPASAPRPAPAPKQEQPPKAPIWRLQVGAYTSKAVADEAEQKLKKAGYRTTIAVGPKYYRLLIQAGTSRSEALAIASRISKLGFAGAFPLESGRQR